MAFSTLVWSEDMLTTWAETLAMRWLRAWQVACRLLFFATGGAVGAEAGGIETHVLIRRFQKGQPLMFEALFNRYKDYVYRVAFYVLRNEAEAEDATQEAFLDVLRALPDYDVAGPARFESWLYRVTVNRCKMRLRKATAPSEAWQDIEERLERLPDPEGERPEVALLRQERTAELWRAVNTLSQEHREVLLLRYQQDLSYEEIAQVLSLKLGTVKSRLYHAHCKLKTILGG